MAENDSPLRVLMVTSEAVPFAKTGGLGDMVSALSAALAELELDVRIVMPRYYGIGRDRLQPLPGPLGVHGREQRVGGSPHDEPSGRDSAGLLARP